MEKIRVTLIGGGTGTFTLLSGLKNYPNLALSAIVAMSDDGGSTGVLRDEYGLLPPGDIRQCLVALSESDIIWRELFTYRFQDGSLAGQSFGNLFIGTLEKITGDFEKALSLAATLLKTNGEIIPVTTDNVRLEAMTDTGKKIRGEHIIDKKNERINSLSLVPKANANIRAIKNIMESDAIIFSPGDFYTSILPNLLVDGICDAIKKSKAKKIYVSNLMVHKNHTDHITVAGFVIALQNYLGSEIFDYVLYNNKNPTKEFMSYYASEGEIPVKVDANNFEKWKKTSFVGHDLISQKVPKRVEGDKVIRGLIRHDSIRTAALIYNLLRNDK